MPPPASLIPKVLIAVLFFAIVYQISTYSAVSIPIPTTIENTDSKNSHADNQGAWLQDAVKPHDGDGRNSHTLDKPPTPSASHHAEIPKPQTNPTSRPQPKWPVNYKKTHVSYGASQCMPHFSDDLKKAAMQRNESCAAHAPFSTVETRRVAFASITTGKPEEAYQRAILSQMFHSAVHGSTTHILCEQLSDGAWNKIAFLLNLVMNEMLRPKAVRAEWMMWIDRDAIVLDACRPLSMFLPPETEDFSKVNLITNNDGFGLNAGVFIFRVSEWSIALFNTILAFRYYRPDEKLVLAEQTAMEKIIKEDKWKESVVRVPWYWFNAYPDESDSVKKYSEGLESEDLEWFRARKGDFVVHFAGDDGRSGRMPDWLNMLQDLGNVWEKGGVRRDITKEIEEYWNSYKDGNLTDNQISGQPN